MESRNLDWFGYATLYNYSRVDGRDQAWIPRDSFLNNEDISFFTPQFHCRVNALDSHLLRMYLRWSVARMPVSLHAYENNYLTARNLSIYKDLNLAFDQSQLDSASRVESDRVLAVTSIVYQCEKTRIFSKSSEQSDCLFQLSPDTEASW